MKSISIIKAPLVSEEYFSGVSMMADSLIMAGLAQSLHAEITTELPLPNWKPERDVQTKILNPEEVRNYSVTLADAVQKDLKAEYFPLVVGGDCTILIGSMLALKRNINPGLYFIDGHADFYQPEISPSGETADMELGFVVGRGPEILANIEGQKPFVKEENTVLFGFRDEKFIKENGGQDVRASKAQCFSWEDTRYYGFNNVVEKSIKNLTAKVDSFWIHLDLDVLDDAVMPAVDYRMPGGLSVGELVNLLQRLTKTGKAVGMSLAIFNPTLDWDGVLAKKIIDIVRAGLSK